jgi:hypothetical protein
MSTTTKTYKIGQRFAYDDNRWILAQTTAFQVCLIRIDGNRPGNRWADPIAVKNPEAITVEELNRISTTGKFRAIRRREKV